MTCKLSTDRYRINTIELFMKNTPFVMELVNKLSKGNKNGFEYLGGGAQGTAFLFVVNGTQYVLKSMACKKGYDTFLNEVNTMIEINNNALKHNIPHLSILLGAYQLPTQFNKNFKGKNITNIGSDLKIDDDYIGNMMRKTPQYNCYMVLPFANSDIEVVSKSLLYGNPNLDDYTKATILLNLIKQQVISVYCFHLAISKFHCDTHPGNFFIFDDPYCNKSGYKKYCIGDYITTVNNLEPITINIGGYLNDDNKKVKIKPKQFNGMYVSLYDLDRSKEPTYLETSPGFCKRYAFDYYRIFSYVGSIYYEINKLSLDPKYHIDIKDDKLKNHRTLKSKAPGFFDFMMNVYSYILEKLDLDWGYLLSQDFFY